MSSDQAAPESGTHAHRAGENAAPRKRPFEPHEDEVWYDTVAGAFDPEPDLGYHPDEDE